MRRKISKASHSSLNKILLHVFWRGIDGTSKLKDRHLLNIYAWLLEIVGLI
jgi:hypothetical protein